MKRHYLILILSFIWKISSSQNLVPNYSFETKTACPNNTDQVYLATPWFNPTAGSSDYLHNCEPFNVLSTPINFWGVQNPRTGLAYTGMCACFHYAGWESYREYIEVKLTSTLILGQKYFISFHVSLGDSVNYATDDFGLYLSNDTIKSNATTNLTVTPQIQNPSGTYLTSKTGWTKVAGTYTANGTENFVTIGNFKDGANTDTLKVAGGSKNPGQSDWYTGYYYVDDVCVSTDSMTCFGTVGINEVSDSPNFKIFPNPFSNKTTLEFNNPYGGNCSLQLFNFKGQPVKFINNINSNKVIIDRDDLVSGLYFFHLYCDKKLIAKGKLTVD